MLPVGVDHHVLRRVAGNGDDGQVGRREIGQRVNTLVAASGQGRPAALAARSLARRYAAPEICAETVFQQAGTRADSYGQCNIR